jgi:beta-glucosidase
MYKVFDRLSPSARLAVFAALGLSAWPLATGVAKDRISKSPAPVTEEVARARADAMIAQMTPEEKAGQLSQSMYLPIFASLVEATPKAIEAGEVGALLMVTDPKETNRLQAIAVEKSRLKIPLLFGFDVLHGLHTIFPVPLAMAASWDPKMVEDIQTVAAAEARAVGLHWAFAPMVDIARDPRWGRIVEGAGEDPYLGAAMASAQVRGFQGPYLGSAGHIIAGPKHFAGYGAALGGRDYDEVDLSESQLWNVYLPPFKAAIDAGAGNIMTAYMSLNGVPASSNRWLLTDVLRERWGFKGFTSSDTNAVRGLVTHGLAADPLDAASRALTAGVDMELVPPAGVGAYHALPDVLRTGKVSAVDLDRAVRNVLIAKIRMGLFETPFVDEGSASSVLNDPLHLTLARIAAERCAVLLRNENGLLPLDRRHVRSLAVIGPLANAGRDTLGSWVFPQNNPHAISVLDGLRTKLGGSIRIDYSEGVRIPPRIFPSPFAMLEKSAPRPELDEDAEIRRASELARNADVTVVVLGETWDMTGESASRSSFALPGRQQELLDTILTTGKPVIVVLMNGRPLDLKDSKPGAILEMWYPGSEGGSAVADLLFGEATPGGKLPITWIRNAGQSPYFYAHMTSHDPRHAEQRYWDGTSAPAYPFGFGLSYTSFAYSNLRAEQPRYAPGESVMILVDVTNTGARSGDEVAQIYLHQRYGNSARPIRELKGFQRITLKPGETRTLHFTLRPDDLRYWSSVTRGWVQDETSFEVWAGGSSAADLSARFDVHRP